MPLQIDDAFISTWNPQYDAIEDDPEYEPLVAKVALEIKSTGTISKKTFLEIWAWKGAMRVIGLTTIYVEGQETRAATSAEDQYETRYAAAFRRAAVEPPERKLAALLGDGVKLPGVGAPTGSTIIHFIRPETMPIIDVRTVEVLFAAGYITTENRDLEHFEEFRKAIDGIRRRCPNWTLRQIDRALFAYHKHKEGHHAEQRLASSTVKVIAALSPSEDLAYETASVREFRREQDATAYKEWIATHPHGFVANCWQEWDRGYIMHRADCYTLVNSQNDNPTANSSAKVCATSEAELDAYARSVLPRCSKCMKFPN